MDGTTSKNAAGIICGEGAKSTTSPESTIENVYVKLTFSETETDTDDKRTDKLVFMGNAMWKTIMKNVIINAPDNIDGKDLNSYGSFARGDAASVSNCYIVSPTATYYPQPAKPFSVVPVRYDNDEQMKAANNNYSSFSSEFWDVSSGIPVWNSLPEENDS